MLAEDDNLVASLIKHRLERDGFEILHFSDGAEALKGMPAGGAALVILDVKMPGLDGFELLTRLRNHPAYKSAPVMMLTALGSESDVTRAYDLGADEYLVKPFQPTELLGRVRRLIARTSAGRTPPETR